MSLVFSEYPAVLKDFQRIISSDDSTKWSAEDDNFVTYATPIIIGQLFKVSIEKHVSEKYYSFRNELHLNVSSINRFIERFMPVGKRTKNAEKKFFVQFKEDDLEKLCRREKPPVGVWRAYDNAKDNIASIRIEECFYNVTPRIFHVTLTVFFIEYTVYRAIVTLLGFLDLIDNRVNQRLLANYVFDINQHLNRQLGVPDLVKVVINFLLVC